jgi:hypothetical protein
VAYWLEPSAKLAEVLGSFPFHAYPIGYFLIITYKYMLYITYESCDFWERILYVITITYGYINSIRIYVLSPPPRYIVVALYVHRPRAKGQGLRPSWPFGDPYKTLY